MKLSGIVALAGCIAAGFLPSVSNADATIVIVRHGEKPAQGLGQLTCQGLNRSLALAPVLLSRYGTPAEIYAPDPGKLKKDHGVPYAYVRPLATIEPLAVRVGLPVNLQWEMTEIKPLAGHILAARSGTHVIAWEHHWGEKLARLLLFRLGGDPDEVPRWKDDDFDSIFVIRIAKDEKGKELVNFRREQEGLDGMPQNCAEALKPAPPARAATE